MNPDFEFMQKTHIIISGTGRAGTTFLVQLFAQLGFDTGFTENAHQHFHSNCNAGLEWDIRQPGAPHIVKSPFLCDYLDDVIESGEVLIEHAFIPMRDLYSAAQSRIDVEKRTDPALYPNGIPGGLWYTDTPDAQELILQRQLYKLMYAIAKHDVPMTLLSFPRLVKEPDYLFRKMSPVLKEMSFEEFLSAFRKVARPELVHNFKPAES